MSAAVNQRQERTPAAVNILRLAQSVFRPGLWNSTVLNLQISQSYSTYLFPRNKAQKCDIEKNKAFACQTFNFQGQLCPCQKRGGRSAIVISISIAIIYEQLGRLASSFWPWGFWSAPSSPWQLVLREKNGLVSSAAVCAWRRSPL